MILQERTDAIQLKGFLASHFCDDAIHASKVREAYVHAQNILNHPDKFPNADFDYLERLSEELYMLSPVACDLGV